MRWRVRSEKLGTGYSGFEVHASPEVTLEEDLLRRDLTVNAIAQRVDGPLILIPLMAREGYRTTRAAAYFFCVW